MIRELTWAERAVWGTCPVCGAIEGQRCQHFIDIPLDGFRHDFHSRGFPHIARIDTAPKRVKIEGIE